MSCHWLVDYARQPQIAFDKVVAFVDAAIFPRPCPAFTVEQLSQLFVHNEQLGTIVLQCPAYGS